MCIVMRSWWLGCTECKGHSHISVHTYTLDRYTHLHPKYFTRGLWHFHPLTCVNNYTQTFMHTKGNQNASMNTSNDMIAVVIIIIYCCSHLFPGLIWWSSADFCCFQGSIWCAFYPGGKMHTHSHTYLFALRRTRAIDVCDFLSQE